MDADVLFYLEDLKTKFAKIKPEEYYLSYSGGRDSHLLLWFIKEYAHIEGIEIVGINTYMEHPQISKRIRDNCDRVLVPRLKPNAIKEKYGIPCFSKFQDEMIKRYQGGCRTDYIFERIRGIEKDGRTTKFRLNKTASSLLLSGKLHKVSGECCKYLKKDPAKRYEKETGKKAIMGVRASEGINRKARYTSCFSKDMRFTPIHDLPDSLLDKIYAEFDIEIPPIYQYIDRTGCMGCPYGTYTGNTEKELLLLPQYKRDFVADYFKESYEVLGIVVPQGD